MLNQGTSLFPNNLNLLFSNFHSRSNI